MIEKGRKRIVYIGVTEEDRAAGLERRIGVQEALRAAGLDAEGLPCETADFNAQSGYEAMCRLLDRCPEPDGVICATDIIAHGAMKALKERGMKIPEDVSIAGVGDNWADMISVPTLTTARLHQRRCGAEAARILLSMIEGESQVNRRPILVTVRPGSGTGSSRESPSDRSGPGDMNDKKE